jgi:hypothetical protein
MITIAPCLRAILASAAASDCAPVDVPRDEGEQLRVGIRG